MNIIEVLKRAAQAATPGVRHWWMSETPPWVIGNAAAPADMGIAVTGNIADAELVALCSPERILQMVAVVEAAAAWDHLGKEKALHVLMCDECRRLEKSHDRWCEQASAIGRRQLLAAKALQQSVGAIT